MRTLLLSGYGISLSVDSGCLHVRNGRDYEKEPVEDVMISMSKRVGVRGIGVDTKEMIGL
jgi:hypothetical protein